MEVLVPIINDTIAEGTEEFFAYLNSVDSNDVKLGDNITTIMIIDDDGVCVRVCVRVYVSACVCMCVCAECMCVSV